MGRVGSRSQTGTIAISTAPSLQTPPRSSVPLRDSISATVTCICSAPASLFVPAREPRTVLLLALEPTTLEPTPPGPTPPGPVTPGPVTPDAKTHDFGMHATPEPANGAGGLERPDVRAETSIRAWRLETVALGRRISASPERPTNHAPSPNRCRAPASSPPTTRNSTSACAAVKRWSGAAPGTMDRSIRAPS